MAHGAVALRRSRGGGSCAITLDHGTDFTSNALDQWFFLSGVSIEFVCQGEFAENGVGGAVNGRGCPKL